VVLQASSKQLIAAWQRRTKELLSAVHVELPVADLVYLVEERSARAGEAPHPSALVADDEALKLKGQLVALLNELIC
jgi:hypothetical protein